MTVTRRGLSRMSGHSPNQKPGRREVDEMRCGLRRRHLDLDRAFDDDPKSAGRVARPIDRLALLELAQLQFVPALAFESPAA